jgi:hypothetical protein
LVRNIGRLAAFDINNKIYMARVLERPSLSRNTLSPLAGDELAR